MRRSLLSTSRMLLFATARTLGEEGTPANLHTANATVGQAIQERRSLAKLLDPNWLEQFDFHQNMLIAIDRINSSQLMAAQYQTEVDITLPPEKQPYCSALCRRPCKMP